MPESQKESLEHSSPVILDLAAHLKDAFLHTEIPDQGYSAIPSDKTFVQMAQYLKDHVTVNLPKPLKQE